MHAPSSPPSSSRSAAPGALVTLVGLARAEQFADHGFWSEPFVHSGPVGRFPVSRRLASAPYEELVLTYEGQRRAWCTGRAGEQRIFEIDDGLLAVSLLESGAAITLEFIERTEHFDRSWGLRVLEDMGYPPVADFLAVTGFVSPVGSRAHKHVDARPFFILQIRGHKRWWVAENREAPHPLEGWGPTWVSEVPLEFRSLADRISPQMPEDSQEFLLEPGDALYVPGGFWHETRSEQDALSLSFIPRVPSWAQLVIDALIERLRAQPRWRAPAVGLHAPALADARHRVTVEHMLADLTEQIRAMDPRSTLACAALRAELPELSSAEILRPRFRGTAAAAESTPDGLLVTTADAEVVVEPDWSALCRWAIARDEPFSLADGWERAAGSLRAPELLRVLEVLLEVGALHQVDESDDDPERA